MKLVHCSTGCKTRRTSRTAESSYPGPSVQLLSHSCVVASQDVWSAALCVNIRRNPLSLTIYLHLFFVLILMLTIPYFGETIISRSVSWLRNPAAATFVCMEVNNDTNEELRI